MLPDSVGTQPSFFSFFFWLLCLSYYTCTDFLVFSFIQYCNLYLFRCNNNYVCHRRHLYSYSLTKTIAHCRPFVKRMVSATVTYSWTILASKVLGQSISCNTPGTKRPCSNR
ncbi:hypothetical protein GGS20DRAFT_561895 [Poronia punctata]|nr:hypothetical protein GGS20DRAFT_561895 [Poronia punctata]